MPRNFKPTAAATPGKSFLLSETHPHLCFSERIVIMEGIKLVKLLLNRFVIQPLWQARE